MNASFGRLVSEVGALAAQVITGNQAGELAESDVSGLMAAAVRLYAAVSESPGRAPDPARLELTPTEACTAAAALLKSQLLTPFEFAIWFSSSTQEGKR